MNVSNLDHSFLLGALVSDAASLGLHWIYDRERLDELTENQIEFTPIDKKNYEGVFSFFAHENRQDGMQSQYGEVLLTAIKWYEEAEFSEMSTRLFQTLFRDHFGFGGTFVGFIDNPTRITLENLAKQDYESVELVKEKFKDVVRDIGEKDFKVVLQKVLPYTRIHNGEDLITPVSRAITITYKDPKILKLALEMAKFIDKNKSLATGADDKQIPALSTIPLLSSWPDIETNHKAKIETMVRVTNNNDYAVESGLWCFHLLNSLRQDRSFIDSVSFATKQFESYWLDLKTQQAVDQKWNSPIDIADHFGMTCYLEEALPALLAIAHSTSSYKEAIQWNITMGGDSCGRAIMLGAICGKLYEKQNEKSIPKEWLAKCSQIPKILL